MICYSLNSFIAQTPEKYVVGQAYKARVFEVDEEKQIFSLSIGKGAFGMFNLIKIIHFNIIKYISIQIRLRECRLFYYYLYNGDIV